jgi:hypothetical protein
MSPLAPILQGFFTDYPEAVVIPMNHAGLPSAGPFRLVGSG